MRCALTESSELLRRELGDEFVNAYIKLKTRGVERVHPPPHRLGAGQHARLLAALLLQHADDCVRYRMMLD